MGHPKWLLQLIDKQWFVQSRILFGCYWSIYGHQQSGQVKEWPGRNWLLVGISESSFSCPLTFPDFSPPRFSFTPGSFINWVTHDTNNLFQLYSWIEQQWDDEPEAHSMGTWLVEAVGLCGGHKQSVQNQCSKLGTFWYFSFPTQPVKWPPVFHGRR